MAKRRVDTKFVLTLGGILLVAGGVAGGYGLTNYLHQRDPVWLTQRGDEALGKGDIKQASQFYATAWVRAKGEDKKNRGTKLADFYYDQSETNTMYYSAAFEAWNKLVQEDRFNTPIQKRLLKETYLRASTLGISSSQAWVDIEKKAEEVSKLDPKDATALQYRANAILRQISNPDLEEKRYLQARDLLEAALTLAPNDADIMLDLTVFDLQKAANLANDRKMKEADQLRKQAMDRVQTFTEQHNKEVNAWLTLARVQASSGKLDEAKKTLNTALALDPKNIKIYEYLYAFNRQLKNSPEAEANIRKILELAPDKLSGHVMLARHYQDTRQNTLALAEYEKVRTMPGHGKGVDALVNESYAVEALYQLCGLQMDLALEKGITSNEGKAALASATTYIEQVKGRRVNDPKLFLYDGRLQLMQGGTIEAIKLLKQADTMFAGMEGANDWLMTKLLLVQAYERTGQTGLARDIYDKILLRFPGAIGVGVQRAALLLRLNENAEARDACLSLLKFDPKNEQVLKILTTAYNALGDRENYKKYVALMPSSDMALTEARTHLLSGEARDALDLVKPILEKDPNHPIAVAIAVPALMQLAETASKKEDGAEYRAEAKKLLTKAIEKDPKNDRYRLMLVVVNNPEATQDELKKEVIKGITDPFEKAVAQAYYHLARNEVDLGLAQLMDAEKLQPKSSEVVDRIFSVAIANKKWDIAGVYAQKGEQLNIDGVNGKFLKGRLEMARGNTETGIKILKEATLLRPDFSVGWTILGQAYLQTNQMGLARESFERAISQKPDNMPALKNLIFINKTMKTPESLAKAVGYLTQARKFAPNDAELLAFDDELGEPKAIIVRRERQRQQTPEDWDNNQRLAVAYVRANEYQKAIDILLPVHAHFPDDLNIANALGRLYRDLNQSDTALKIFEPYLASPDEKVQFAALLSVADLYHSMGQMQAAMATYRSAQAKQPKGSNEADRFIADLFFELEDMPHAEEMYRQIDAQDGGRNPLVVKRLVETLIRQDKFQDADDLLNQRVFAKDNPEDAQGLILRGYAQLRQGKPEEALKSFNTVLEKQPDNVDALHYRASAQINMQGDIDQSIKDLKQLRTTHPEAMNSRLLLARAYRMNRQYAESIQVYQEILKEKPNMLAARADLADYLYTLVAPYLHLTKDSRDSYALTLRNVKPIETLMTLLDESIKLYPNQPEWLSLSGDLAAQLNNKPQALAFHLRAAEVSKWNPQTSAAVLSDWLREKNYERVVDMATKMLQEYPDTVELYINRGMALSGQGKTKEAMADFDKGLDLATKRLDTFLTVVRQMSNSVPTQLALDHLKARYAADPTNVGIQVGLIQVYLTSEQYAEALKILDPIMADQKSTLRPKVLGMAALAHYQLKDYEATQKLYEEILTRQPDDLETLNNLAFLLAENLKRPADGVKYAEKAVKVLKSKPQEIVYVNNGNVFDTLGWVKYLNGDNSGAVEELSRAVQIDPLPITYLHLGTVLQKQKKLGEARARLEEGRKLAQAKNDPVLPQIEQLLRELK